MISLCCNGIQKPSFLGFFGIPSIPFNINLLLFAMQNWCGIPPYTLIFEFEKLEFLNQMLCQNPGGLCHQKMKKIAMQKCLLLIEAQKIFWR